MMVSYVDSMALLRVDAEVFDFQLAQETKQEIVETLAMHTGCIVLDLSSVVFMDAAGLSLLVSLLKSIHYTKEERLTIVNLSTQPQQMITTAGIDKVFPCIKI